MRVSLVAILLAGLLLLPAPAEAYICTRVQDDLGQETGPSLSWSSRDLDFALHAQGTNRVAGDEELAVLRNSFAPWGRVYDDAGELHGDPPEETANGCVTIGNCRTTNLTFREAEELSNRDVVGYDFLHPEANENLLIFRDDAWPMPGQEDAIIALTTTTYNALTGEILDADIEFNSARFIFTITDTLAQVDTDLMNTAVHEIGHYLGLAHSEIKAATMYKQAGDAEISKRVLHEDDRNGIVFKYPWGEINGYCTAASTNCSCAPPGALVSVPTATAANHDDGLSSKGCDLLGGGWLAAWVGALVLVWRRRRALRV